MTHRIVLDTDIGSDVDDALALALALASPELELVAVTTVAGDTVLRAAIARRLLDLGGRGDVPVFAGSTEPLTPWASPFPVWGNEGRGILDPGAPLPPASGEAAPAALARLVAQHDDLELVAIGPLTNVAAALEADPGLARRIRRLTVMGGHVRRVAHGDHVFPPGVDYNLCSDPDASCRVLRAGIPTRLVTADVTLRCWLEPADVERLATLPGPLAGTLVAAIRHWTPLQERIFAGMGCRLAPAVAAFLHDPLALACVYDESLCTFEDLPIETCIASDVLRTFERRAPGPEAPLLRCATAVDAARVRAHVLERLLVAGQASPAPR